MSQMMNTAPRLLLVSFLLVACKSLGCMAAPESVSAQEAAPGATQEAELRSRPLAMKQCRGPEFPGCNVCCEPGAGSSCLVRSWEPSGAPTSGVIPWYNSTASQEGDCPTDCRPCATCLTRSERDYAALGARPECDCATQEIGIDPCRSPRSCACYCKRKAAILRSCPHLAP